MKIYTRTGDTGQTGLFGGPRVAKDDARIEAYGTVDELNAVLGVVAAGDLPAELEEILLPVQHELFEIGAELATPEPAAHRTATIDEAPIARMEQQIDRLEAKLEPLKVFILPGGTPTAAHLHVARTVCRRAERRLVTLARRDERVSERLIIYLNRLSDLLFVMARRANALAGQADIPWEKPPASYA